MRILRFHCLISRARLWSPIFNIRVRAAETRFDSTETGLKTADQREKEQKDKADAERAARQKSERDSVLRRESALLLQQFDEAMAGEERQQRGYFLQDLLNRAFDLHGIPAARLLADWLVGIGLDPHVYGTHSLRRTKATLIYRRTGNLRAVQLLLGHTKIESTVRYLGIDIDDALAISEQVDI